MFEPILAGGADWTGLGAPDTGFRVFRGLQSPSGDLFTGLRSFGGFAAER